MLEFLKENKKIIIIIIFVGIIGITYIFNSIEEENILVDNDIVSETISETEENNNSDTVIIVHITGAVKTPGLVKINEGSRIEDAIEAAGGLTEDADISQVNLAYVVEDGMKIIIPSVSDEDLSENSYIIVGSGENVMEDSINSNSTININKASQAELETLNGIGPSLAARIISYREENGNFKTIDELKNVSGIGDSKFENIKDYITV